MDDSHIGSIAQIQEFIKVGKDITFQGTSRKEQYAWIEEIILRFRYFSLCKKEKSEGIKGVYHINLVDEVTQWEIVAAVEKISEYYLMPALSDALDQFPFQIIGFHSDNGSEYINAVVARLLNKLLIQQTKSRARHGNDNALVEGKNGSIIRKHMGRMHIGQKHAMAINEFYWAYLNPYLNYHRPCGFATQTISEKGKIKKVYNLYRTPYEALVGHPRASEFLKDGVSWEKLDVAAHNQSDNECASVVQEKKYQLFKNFKS